MDEQIEVKTKHKWSELNKKEKVFWIATYSLIIATILFLGAWSIGIVKVYLVG